MRTFLFGLLLGAVAGVLYAPANGKRTRTLMKDKATKLSSDTADLLGNKRKDLNNRLQGAKENFSRAVDQVKPRLDRVANTARGAYGNLRADVKSASQQTIDSTQQAIDETKRQSA